jgi:hypothetical protein
MNPLRRFLNVMHELSYSALIQQIQIIKRFVVRNVIGLAGMNQGLLTIRLHGCVSNRPNTPSAVRRLLRGADLAEMAAVSHRWTRLGT